MIVRHALALLTRGRLSVLTFHRVLREPDPLLPGEPSGQQFEALLAHVKRTYSVLALAEATRRLYDRTLPASAVAITIDDGYADNLLVAAPILKRLRLPATVFVASGYLDGGCMFNDMVIEAVRGARSERLDLDRLGLGNHSLASTGDRRAAIDAIIGKIKYLAPGERIQRAEDVLRVAGTTAPQHLMLRREQVAALADFGVDIGGHTITHPILTNMRPEDAWQEIRRGKEDLEAIVQSDVSMFAYPNGFPDTDYTIDHAAMVKQAGYAAGWTTSMGAASRDSDPMQLPRFTPWTRQPLKFDLLMLRNFRQGREQVATPIEGAGRRAMA